MNKQDKKVINEAVNKECKDLGIECNQLQVFVNLPDDVNHSDIEVVENSTEVVGVSMDSWWK
jgi:hypothetical protein